MGKSQKIKYKASKDILLALVSRLSWRMGLDRKRTNLDRKGCVKHVIPFLDNMPLDP